MNSHKDRKQSPWTWVPTLYYAEGIPYVIVMTVAVIMYKNLGLSNTDIAFYTSWLYLPWVIKPFWSPLVDLFSTKRKWILAMQLLIGAGLACIALTIPVHHFLQYTLAFFWLLAFCSATHDIAADGFYLLSLSSGKQAYFIGIRSTFYRFAMISGQGLLVILAGYLEEVMPTIKIAWAVTFGLISAVFFLFAAYHFFMVPKVSLDEKREIRKASEVFTGFARTIVSFFQKDNVWIGILFLMVYRLGESQLVKIASPFLLDPRDVGGLGLSTSEVGLIYGTFGIIALTVGGLIGGIVASRKGLKYWIWMMLLAINLPNAVYIYLSFYQPESFLWIGLSVVVEQFGYGFGFTGYMLFMIFMARGPYSTAHFAITTGFMALGMMLPGMISGWVQELLGYEYFFVWVLIATIPSFFVTSFLKLDPNFGKK